MNAIYVPPDVALTAPGICHNLPITGAPLAGDVTPDGTGHLEIGRICGQAVVIASPSVAFLDGLESAIQVERARLALWHQDHDMHPFDGAA